MKFVPAYCIFLSYSLLYRSYIWVDLWLEIYRVFHNYLATHISVAGQLLRLTCVMISVYLKNYTNGGTVLSPKCTAPSKIHRKKLNNDKNMMFALKNGVYSKVLLVWKSRWNSHFLSSHFLDEQEYGICRVLRPRKWMNLMSPAPNKT